MYNSSYTFDEYSNIFDDVQNQIASGKTTLRLIAPVRYNVNKLCDTVAEAVRDMYYEVASITIRGTYVTVDVRSAY